MFNAARWYCAEFLVVVVDTVYAALAGLIAGDV